ncbi:MAG: DUF4157 domain-containing protein [Chloroflexi bacterium]|nr:DUF4157 domain-containing protein [Chloroflexota bacterium]
MHDDLERGSQRPVPRRTEDAAASGPTAADGRATGDAGAMLQLQRLAGNASVSRMVAEDEQARSPVLDVVGSGGGRPLDDGLRAEMEGKLGADFGDVRLHTDARATASAKAVDANAYTVGSDVVVRSERFDPASTDGKKTLAHELAHVVQQRAGPVAGTPVPGGVSISDPGDRFERAAVTVADAVVTASPPTPVTGAGSSVAQRELADTSTTADDPAVQRQGAEEDEEEELPGQAVQRQTPDEEEEELPTSA